MAGANREYAAPEGEHIYEGLRFSKTIPDDALMKVTKEMTYRKDDILVVTYPKSATTWVTEILSLLINDGNIEKCKTEAAYLRTPHMEHHPPNLENPIYYLLDSVPSPRILKTHLPVHMLQRALEADVKIILVFRNLKDVLVSLYYHYQGLYQFNEGWDAFFELFKADRLIYGSWFEHTLGWLKASHTHGKSIHCTCFEALKADTPTEIFKIAEFIGKKTSPTIVETIAKGTAFEKMRGNSSVNFKKMFATYNNLRKGDVGDWKKHFTVAQNEYFDGVYREKMGCKKYMLASFDDKYLK